MHLFSELLINVQVTVETIYFAIRKRTIDVINQYLTFQNMLSVSDHI